MVRLKQSQHSHKTSKHGCRPRIPTPTSRNIKNLQKHAVQGGITLQNLDPSKIHSCHFENQVSVGKTSHEQGQVLHLKYQESGHLTLQTIPNYPCNFLGRPAFFARQRCVKCETSAGHGHRLCRDLAFLMSR